MTIRRDFPALNPAQVQQILGEYQLGPGKSRPRGWFPPPEEVEPALRTGKLKKENAHHRFVFLNSFIVATKRAQLGQRLRDKGFCLLSIIQHSYVTQTYFLQFWLSQ